VLQATVRQIEQRRATAQTLQSHQAGFANIQRIDFHLRTMAEARLSPACCPRWPRTRKRR
jgi:hypothetical protein